MSDLVKEHGISKLLSLLLLIFVSSLFVILTLVPSSNLQQGIEIEVKSLSKLISQNNWVSLTDKIEINYLEKYINSGLQDMVSDALLPKSDYKIKKIINEFKGEFILERVVNNIHLMAYQVIYRLSVFKYWSLIMLPFMVAVIYDGLMTRSIRMYEPKQISIKASRIWTRSIVYIVVFTFCYLLLPNVLGQHAPWYPVVMLFILGIALKYTIRNYMKVA